MARLKFEGEIKQRPDGTFAVEIAIAGFATMAEASEAGAAVHDRVTSFFEGKGATLLVNDPAAKRPGIILQS